MKLTKKGAKQVTETLDRIASLMQENYETLGLDQDLAMKFAFSCDKMSDSIEKKADFDASNIGKEVGGPLEQIDSDEPWMNGHFTQQNFRDVREFAESGALSCPEAPKPTPGKQAALADLAKAKVRLRSAFVCSDNASLKDPVKKLAEALTEVEENLEEGKADKEKTAMVIDAVNKVIPHIASSTKESTSKVAKMINLATIVASEKDEDEEGEDIGLKKTAPHGFILDAE